MTFWDKLAKPFFVLAPMADVTDPAYRKLIALTAKPDVMWTEFVSADGLYHTREPKRGFTKPPYQDEGNPLMRDLLYSEAERPIIAQIFSGKPEMIAYATALAEKLGFDGVDLNMGCPVGPVVKQGAGSALIQKPALAVELIRAAKAATTLPVSVKTRVGYNSENLEEWLPILLTEEPAAITLHLRTKKEMSAVPANWGYMKKAVEIRERLGSKVLLIGNGDVKSIEEARAKVLETGCDGVMLGRAIFGNPWLFSGRTSEEVPVAEKLAALAQLARNFEELRPPKHFAILKKHFKAFVSGFDGASDLRAKLMEAENASELSSIILKFSSLYT
jgi:nifR3 family TIM-barrel protein